MHVTRLHLRLTWYTTQLQSEKYHKTGVQRKFGITVNHGTEIEISLPMHLKVEPPQKAIFLIHSTYLLAYTFRKGPTSC